MTPPTQYRQSAIYVEWYLVSQRPDKSRWTYIRHTTNLIGGDVTPPYALHRQIPIYRFWDKKNHTARYGSLRLRNIWKEIENGIV